MTPPFTSTYIKLLKKLLYDQKRNYRLYGKPRRWCPYTVKNGLIYSILSTQHLSFLDPSSDYLDITVKIKRASPIHFLISMSLLSALFLLTNALNPSHPFSYYCPLLLTFSVISISITHPGTLTARRTD